MTLLVTWTRANAVGVQAMDNEHAIMMDAMNELRAALVHGEKREQVHELMDKLIEFTRMHFRNEEHLLERFGFSGLDEQKTEHRRLLEQLQESFYRVRQGEAVSLGDLLLFLHDWFLDHVEGLDQKYGPWLNEQGVN
jgi:hemerythrin-like metal-binding protein